MYTMKTQTCPPPLKADILDVLHHILINNFTNDQLLKISMVFEQIYHLVYMVMKYNCKFYAYYNIQENLGDDQSYWCLIYFAIEKIFGCCANFIS